MIKEKLQELDGDKLNEIYKQWNYSFGEAFFVRESKKIIEFLKENLPKIEYGDTDMEKINALYEMYFLYKKQYFQGLDDKYIFPVIMQFFAEDYRSIYYISKAMENRYYNAYNLLYHAYMLAVKTVFDAIMNYID